MKKLNRINLHNLSQAELAKREKNLLRGGGCACGCSYDCLCKYEGPQTDINDPFYGGSSTHDNDNANTSNLGQSTAEKAGGV